MYKKGWQNIYSFSIILWLIGVIAPIKVPAAAISQGYTSDSELTVGSVVSLTNEGGQKVVKTNTSNDQLAVGVVVSAEQSLIDILPAGSQVRVAINGDVQILVSTVNGDIKKGDRLIASPLSGIATLDWPPAPGVKYIAQAASDFNAKSSGAKEISVKQTDGSQKKLHVGIIPAKMLLANRTAGSGDQNPLTKLAKQITGQDVSLLQVIAAGAIFLTTLGLTGMVLQSSIRATFISMGRNPLAKDSILTGLLRIVVIALLILSAGGGISYLIIKI